jgi:hypothetical protein
MIQTKCVIDLTMLGFGCWDCSCDLQHHSCHSNGESHIDLGEDEDHPVVAVLELNLTTMTL